MEVTTFKTSGILKEKDGKEELVIIEKNVPVKLGVYEVLIKVKACALPSLKDFGPPTVSAVCELVPFGTDIAGVVERIGIGVTSLAVGDRVTGIVSLHYQESGCGEYIKINEYDVAKISDSLSYVKAAATIGDGIRAYMALFYLGKLQAGNKVLVLNGSMACPSLCIQLAYHAGAKVFVTCNSTDEERYMETLQYCIDHIISVENCENIRGKFYDECMKKTGNLGVDMIIDITRNRDEEDQDNGSLISCLTVGGRWITSNSQLQLDPPDSASLFNYAASLCFLNEQAFMMSAMFKGKYQHILSDICYRIEKRMLTSYIHHTVEFDQLSEAFTALSVNNIGKVVLTFE